jgi:hypothetical protein
LETRLRRKRHFEILVSGASLRLQRTLGLFVAFVRTLFDCVGRKVTPAKA